MVIKKRFQLIIFLRKLLINNTVPRTKYTQLHQLGGLEER